MARVNLPTTLITRAGVAPAAEVPGDATNNHSFVNTNGDVLLLARNADAGAAHTVTVHLAEVIDGQSVASRTISVPQSSSVYVGLFPTSMYGATVLVDVDSTQLKLSAYLIES